MNITSKFAAAALFVAALSPILARGTESQPAAPPASTDEARAQAAERYALISKGIGLVRVTPQDLRRVPRSTDEARELAAASRAPKETPCIAKEGS